MEKERTAEEQKGFLSRVKSFPQLSILIVFIVLFIILSVVTKHFLSASNIINVVRQASSTIIVALGMTYVLILGGIDLSVGSNACFSGVFAAGLMYYNGVPVPLGILVGLLLGCAIGLVNGVIIAKVKIPAFIVTLALMTTMRGAVLVYSGGRPVTGIPEGALQIGRGFIGPLPVPIVIMIAVTAVLWIVLAFTRFGRHVYATGGNESCARLSGVHTDRVTIAVYTISGFCAGLCGIILTMRLASGQPTMGEGLEMDAIAASVLGGTTLSGGKGYVFGTILGCMFMQLLTNGMNILKINSYWQQVLTGIILLIAVSFYDRSKNK